MSKATKAQEPYAQALAASKAWRTAKGQRFNAALAYIRQLNIFRTLESAGRLERRDLVAMGDARERFVTGRSTYRNNWGSKRRSRAGAG